MGPGPPVCPGGPVRPWGPCGPCGPVGPPAGPGSPGAPGAPVAPVGPVTPEAPGGPGMLLTLAFFLASAEPPFFLPFLPPFFPPLPPCPFCWAETPEIPSAASKASAAPPSPRTAARRGAGSASVRMIESNRFSSMLSTPQHGCWVSFVAPTRGGARDPVRAGRGFPSLPRPVGYLLSTARDACARPFTTQARLRSMSAVPLNVRSMRRHPPKSRLIRGAT